MFQYYGHIHVQSNLDSSNADISKLSDFLKTFDGLENFSLCLL